MKLIDTHQRLGFVPPGKPVPLVNDLDMLRLSSKDTSDNTYSIYGIGVWPDANHWTLP